MSGHILRGKVRGFSVRTTNQCQGNRYSPECGRGTELSVLLYLRRDAGKRSSSMGEIRVDQLVPISWDVDQMGTTFCVTMERVNIRGDWWFGGHTVQDNHEPGYP